MKEGGAELASLESEVKQVTEKVRCVAEENAAKQQELDQEVRNVNMGHASGGMVMGCY